MSLRICSTIKEIRDARKAVAPNDKVAFVPTMGALHEGHRSLIRAARKNAQTVIVSIFVNPLQFGPNEDLNKYPRTLAEDCRVLEEEGVHLLFAPSVEEMYPQGATTFVETGELGNRLDGASRPGHFRGVATVVLKLFNIVQPDVAFFGQKDAAQVAVLKAMVRDLDVPVQLEVCPTVRDTDGLALSSRNRYLTDSERVDALALSRALNAVVEEVRQGAYFSSTIREHLLAHLAASSTIKIDYVEIVSPETLLPISDVRDGALVAIAAWVGKTRLIDNVILAPDSCGVCA